MFASLGVIPESLQASPVATPCFWAPVLWFAFGEILPLASSNCSDFEVARPAWPTRPCVASADTTPPALEGTWFTDPGGLAELSPPPPPHPATARAPTRSSDGAADLISVRIRFAEPSMPVGYRSWGVSFLSVSAHAPVRQAFFLG